MKRLLGTDDIGGRVERYWQHQSDNGTAITVETVQDVEPILDGAKREYADAPSRFGPGTFHKVATIPFTVAEELCRQRGLPMREFMQNNTDKARAVWNELLNARELRSFRTRPGRIDMRQA